MKRNGNIFAQYILNLHFARHMVHTKVLIKVHTKVLMKVHVGYLTLANEILTVAA